MNILVTGGSGFVGSCITEYLSQKGQTLIVPTRSLLGCWRLESRENITIIEGDMKDAAFQKRLFTQYKPQVIIHAAWDGMTRDKREDPSQINNLMLTESLLRLTTAFGCPLFIGFGSQAEYGVYNKEISEDFPTNPDNLYGVYKLTAGLLGKWYAAKYGFNFAWLRLFSSFGPKDMENYIIPYAIRSFLKAETPRFSDCEQCWDYLYVKDIARMVAQVIDKKDKFCDIYNLSSSESFRLRVIIETLKDLTQAKVQPQFGVLPQNPNGLMYLKGNNQKFQQTFGRQHFTPLRQALEETVGWYAKHSQSNP